MLIYKIFRTPEWRQLQSDGQTAGAPVDRADGYVHFSTADQLAETAARHFSGETELMLLALDSDRLGPDLKWEASRGGALFPHLYRHLNLKDIVWARDLPLDPDGHRLPEDI